MDQAVKSLTIKAFVFSLVPVFFALFLPIMTFLSVLIFHTAAVFGYYLFSLLILGFISSVIGLIFGIKAWHGARVQGLDYSMARNSFIISVLVFLGFGFYFISFAMNGYQSYVSSQEANPVNYSLQGAEEQAQLYRDQHSPAQ